MQEIVWSTEQEFTEGKPHCGFTAKHHADRRVWVIWTRTLEADEIRRTTYKYTLREEWLDRDDVPDFIREAIARAQVAG